MLFCYEQSHWTKKVITSIYHTIKYSWHNVTHMWHISEGKQVTDMILIRLIWTDVSAPPCLLEIYNLLIISNYHEPVSLHTGMLTRNIQYVNVISKFLNSNFGKSPGRLSDLLFFRYLPSNCAFLELEQ